MPPGGDRTTCSSSASGDATPEETLRVGLHWAPSIRLDIPHLELESLHPSSFIPHPASRILHPHILHPRIMQPSILHPHIPRPRIPHRSPGSASLEAGDALQPSTGHCG